MEHLSHTAVMNWLVHLSNASPGLLSPPTLYLHLAACQQCQAELALLMLTSPGFPPPSQAYECAIDLEAIAAFIDDEMRLGTYQALLDHALIWWHLVRCRGCAELYASIVADLAVAQTADFNPAPCLADPSLPMFTPNLFLQRYHKLGPELTISVGQLYALTQYQQTQFRETEEDQEPSVINEVSDSDLTVEATLVLRKGLWVIVLKVEPSITGRAVAAIGEQYFYARFEQGVATFADFHSALFTKDPLVAIRLFAEKALE